MPKAFPAEMYSSLVCVCDPNATLIREQDDLVCSRCALRHPIVDGVPVIFHPENSVFDATETIERYRASARRPKRNLFATLRRFVPKVRANLIADQIAGRIRSMLPPGSKPRVLVVGGGDTGGAGLQSILDDPNCTTIESDIHFGARANLIADGHNLPFRSETFDVVICQAVLEHVARPQRCVDEIHRVLKPNGILFADIPFMCPVHMGPYDFTRFSLGGLRLACRRFEEEAAGMSHGPFAAVAMNIFHAARSLSTSRVWATFVWFGLPWLIFWIPHLDKLFRNRAQATDAAAGVYFIGRKSERTRSERAIIRQHWSYHVAKRRKPAVVEGSGAAKPTPAMNTEHSG